MTPEEIEAICSFVGIRQYWGDLSNEQLYQRINKYHEWLSGLCDHVKCQAKQITELETQVAALQEIAVEEGAYRAYYEANAQTESYADFGYSLVAHGLFSDARDRLTKEHPEAFR